MKVILISGKQGSGKTTLQKLLESALRATLISGNEVHFVNFADILYEMHHAVLAILDKYWPKRDIVKDGPLLQMLGTDWGRKTIDENIWVKCLQNKLAALPGGFALVGDCRFENEFDGFENALRIRLECPEAVRKQRCSMWRDNTAHPSETGLDKYAAEGLFDLYFNTDTESPEECSRLIIETLAKGDWISRRRSPAERKAAKHFEGMAKDFTESLRMVEDHTGCRANFRWNYGKDGTKELVVADVGVYTPPSPEAVEAALNTVPDLMKQAEELVGKPVEIKPNEQNA